MRHLFDRHSLRLVWLLILFAGAPTPPASAAAAPSVAASPRPAAGREPPPAEGTPGTELKIDEFERVMQVNALGPVRVTQALLPNLRAGKGKMIVGISSVLGSIAANREGGFYGYRESKAALDMFMRGLAAELKREG